KKTTSLTQELVKSDIALEEYVVLAPAVEGSLASTFAELKDSDTIGDLVGSEQFSKQGDSSASGALKRISGITIVGGKYVYVRGLGERYSTVMLNGLNVPSPNPLKRVVPLDIFPTSIIESLLVQKTYSPNLPGNFGGGAVDIKTKGIPKEDNFISASFGTTYSDATGKKGYYNSDNSVGIPNSVVSATDNFSSFGDSELFTEEDKINYAKQLSQYRNFNLTQKTIEPGKSVSLSTGQSYKTSSGLKYGFAGNLYYKTDADIKDFTKTSYSTSPDGTSTVQGNKGSYSNTQFVEKKGGLVSFEADNTEGQSIKFTTMYLEQAKDSTTYGRVIETGSNDRIVDRTILTYTEESLSLNQLNGTNTIFFGKTTDNLFDDIVINWGVEKGTAKNQQPGTVDYEYHYTGDVEQEPPYEDELFKLYTDKPINYITSELEDNLDDKKVSFSLPFKFNEQKNYFEIGFAKLKKDRILDSRRYTLQYVADTKTECTQKNINEFLGGFEIKEGCYYDRNESVDDFLDIYSTDEKGYFTTLTPFKPSDYYEASQNIDATYFRTKISPTNNIDIVFGQRIEQSTQTMKTSSVDTGTLVVETYKLKTNDALPELSSIYRINDDLQLKGSYSKSISRPDFREFVNNEYTDPITAEATVGYANLEYTTITNYDISFEHYLSYDEKYSIAFFKKDFDKPIETVVSEVGDKIGYTLRNAKKAESTGIEIGFRKKFNFIHQNLNNYFISGNYSLISSKITLDKNGDDNVINALRSNDRPMQGQSPYVTNINFGYDNINTGRSAIFTYNESGKRIVALGTLDAGTVDLYEQPFKKLDFVVKYKLNDTYDLNEKKIGYTLKFKATNLLDDEATITHNDKIV
ncbi:MAG: TonB-dependent receptor, partial [Campylobacterota bacterium]|nr:TonB-dependent receptor [Campylobacterota bacterium]